MRHFVVVLWGLAMGAIVLDVFFTAVGGLSPRDAGAATLVVALLGLGWLVRSARIEFELRSRGGDPQLRSQHNRLRERRGF